MIAFLLVIAWAIFCYIGFKSMDNGHKLDRIEAEVKKLRGGG